MVYRAAAEVVPVRRVAVRPLAGPEVITSLAVWPAPPGSAVRLLLESVHEALD
ncbi:hypothetical protein [Streptomyces sp. NPDC001530]|uniref:hypothetical protein n=1 Tax=Streptomyces sp. NPDC001530 TaxID=3364582 RepID=UPI0036B3CF75